MITHYQAVRGGYSHVRGVRATADDVFLVYFPWHIHSGVVPHLSQPVLIQASVILMESFRPNRRRKLSSPKTDTPTWLPRPLHHGNESSEHRQDDLSSLRAGYLPVKYARKEISSGEKRGTYTFHLPGGTRKSAQGRHHVSLWDTARNTQKTVGKPIPGTRGESDRPGYRREVDEGVIGELMVRGPTS